MKDTHDKNFDDFIEKMLIEDSIVPAGLEWENMDIEIPKKESRRPFFFLLTSLGLIALLYFGYTSLNKIDGTVIQNQNRITVIENQIVDSSLLKKEKTPSVSNEQNIQSNLNTTKESIPSPMNKMDVNTYGPAVSNSNTILSKKPDAITSNLNLNESTTLEQNSLLLHKENKNDFNYLTIIKQNRQTFELQTLAFSPILFNSKFKDTTLDLFTNIVEPKSTPTVQKEQLMFFTIGNNINSLNFNNATVLENQIDPELGLSLSMGYQRALSKNYVLILGARYDEIHTSFTDSRKINETYNQLVKITTIQHTYQNNYSKYLGLNLGLGRNFGISDRFAIQTNLMIAPKFLISHQGKTVTDGEITDLQLIDSPKNFSLNINPSLHLTFDISASNAIRFGYEFNAAVLNEHFVNESVNSKTMHQIFIGGEHKF